jgi:hypothetical protein
MAAWSTLPWWSDYWPDLIDGLQSPHPDIQEIVTELFEGAGYDREAIRALLLQPRFSSFKESLPRASVIC